MSSYAYPISPRENYFRLMKNEDPRYLCNEHMYTKGFFFDPILQSGPRRIEGEVTKDSWGVSWKWLKGHVAANPYINEETKVIKDITQWEKYVKVPWPSQVTEGWEEARARADAFDRENYILMCCCFGGLFEMSHYLMGFEDALMNYLMEPEAITVSSSVIASGSIR